ncbi:MAG: DUF3592 domain-containing protein [Burkholderiaceae bacterium]|nr:DUF3592 domain-containing protein [Burkholderiaceae bacterium]
MIGVFMLVVGSLAIVSVWAAYVVDSRLQDHGARATGSVVRKEFVRSADGDSDHLVIYRFSPPSGQEIVAQRSLPKARWNQLTSGSPLIVVYSSNDPKRNFPEGSGVTSIVAPLFTTVIFGFLVLLGGAIVVQLVRDRAKPRLS